MAQCPGGRPIICDKWFKRGSYYIRAFIRRDFSLYQHKEAIGMNLEFEEFLMFFFLKVLCFFQHIIIYVLFNINL